MVNGMFVDEKTKGGERQTYRQVDLGQSGALGVLHGIAFRRMGRRFLLGRRSRFPLGKGNLVLRWALWKGLRGHFAGFHFSVLEFVILVATCRVRKAALDSLWKRQRPIAFGSLASGHPSYDDARE